MKVASLIAFAGLIAPTTPASTELPECNLFPDMQSRFACYDNVSRAPKPEPKETARIDAAKPKADKAKPRPRMGEK